MAIKLIETADSQIVIGIRRDKKPSKAVIDFTTFHALKILESIKALERVSEEIQTVATVRGDHSLSDVRLFKRRIVPVKKTPKSRSKG